MTRVPLQELPLEQFLLTNNDDPNNDLNHSPTSSHTSKRPLSPSSYSFLSPAKRRVMDTNIFFTPPRAQSASSSAKSGRSSTPLIRDILRGPESPARRLDFGTPKPKFQVGKINVRSLSTLTSTKSNLAPSPELKKSFALTTSIHGSPINSSTPSDVDDCFSPRKAVKKPRPLPDVNHHPGFDVYVDTSDTSVAECPLVPAPVSVSEDSKQRQEIDKENRPPSPDHAKESSVSKSSCDRDLGKSKSSGKRRSDRV
ncbi:hypothetical protein ABKN59_000668 [Abortiporus biennis]